VSTLLCDPGTGVSQPSAGNFFIEVMVVDAEIGEAVSPTFGSAAPFSEGLAVAALPGVWDESEPPADSAYGNGTPIPRWIRALVSQSIT
jgi:hypothetical protein